MKEYFKEYLFFHNILVSESKEKNENMFETTYAIAKLFNIRITSGYEYVNPSMIPFIEKCLGIDVPEPFYKGFPNSVRELSEDALLFDQLVHYWQIYGQGAFQTGHSILEKDFQRSAFCEEAVIKNYVVIKESEAIVKLAQYAGSLLLSTRALSDTQFKFVCEYIREYDYSVDVCASKNTAVKLLLEFRNVKYTKFITMSDVIKLVDEMNYQQYGNDNVKKLNLKNQDRRFITAVINELFHTESCDMQTCCEKKDVWNGLLHHIHYRPFDDISRQFVQIMRGKENISVYSEFEKAMIQKDIQDAVHILQTGKGSGAVLRHLNYILSRTAREEDLQYVLHQIKTKNGIMLLQLLMSYSLYDPDSRRTFKFIRHNKLTVHEETEDEKVHRLSMLSGETIDTLKKEIQAQLEQVYAGKLDRVYIDPDMKNIALPIQEGASQGGFGILPKGSRLAFPKGKKIRAFTYWEKVDDIDLSLIGLCKDGTQKEFSWRSMWFKQSGAITFSGDEISGYKGGSEYFDVDLPEFRKKYPKITHLVFCNNVYSNLTFDKCFCKAGYMLRDTLDSGEVYEPKTVSTSFTINCESHFAYLFAIDLAKSELIWLNLGRSSNANVAGTTDLHFLKAYFDITNVINLYDFFAMMAGEIVNDPSLADVVVTDKDVHVKDGVEIIRPLDTERIMALMNKR